MAQNTHDQAREERTAALRLRRQDEQYAREMASFLWQTRHAERYWPGNVLGLPGRWPATDENDPDDGPDDDGGDAA